jgi:hypothetical protein
MAELAAAVERRPDETRASVGLAPERIDAEAPRS